MSDEREAAIRARLDAATDGPWRWAYPGSDSPELVGTVGDENYSYEIDVLVAEHHGECGCRSSCHLELTIGNEADAELISNAPADLEWLLAEVVRLRETIADEIEAAAIRFGAACSSNGAGYLDGLEVAANIARGPAASLPEDVSS